MAYRFSTLTPDSVPWNETTLFRVLQFTLFPVIRLATLSIKIIWAVLVIVTWFPTIAIAPLFGYLFFGDSTRYIRTVPENDPCGAPYVFSFMSIFQITEHKVLKAFLGEEEDED